MKLYPSSSQVLDQLNGVQKLVIPFTLEGSATPASVVAKSGLPGVLSIATEGLSVSAVDASATGAALVDGDGKFALLLSLGDSVDQVLDAKLMRPAATASNVDVIGYVDADGLSASGNIWLQCDSAIATSAAATTGYVLEVQYKLA
jgi:hypothetical protein